MGDFEETLVDEIPRLRRMARAMVGDPSLADDLVQDTVERALVRRWQWRRQGPLRFWLARILVNRLRNGSRRRALERRGSEILSLVAGAGTQPPDQVPRLRVSEVGEAIQQLPDEQRTVLVLVVVEGMAYDEVAAVLDVPIGTVRSRLARARTALSSRPKSDRQRLRRVK